MRISLEETRVVGVVPTEQNLFALSGIAPGSLVVVQNQSQHAIHLHYGDSAASELRDSIVLDEWRSFRVKAEVLTAWSIRAGADIVIHELSQ